MQDVYESKDKQIVPFLLITSEVSFIGTRNENGILYFQFSPLEKCQEIINAFLSRRAPLVQPKDLLDAVETFRDRIFEEKNRVQP